MLAFYNEYAGLSIWPTALAKLSAEEVSSPDTKLLELVLLLPWAHNVALLNVKDITARVWYMMQSLKHGWSHDWLTEQIKHQTYERQGKAVTNFATRLPALQSALAQESLKDP